MDVKNKKTIILLVLIAAIVLFGILFGTGVISLKSDETPPPEDNKTTYRFGDTIFLKSLANIDFSSIGFPKEHGNFSVWKVISADEEYITLYYSGNDELYGKADKDDTITKFDERKTLFTSNGIDFGDDGEIRILNEDDLILFGCNFKTFNCPSAPDWISGWTSYTKDNYKYSLSDGKLYQIEKDAPVLIFSNPIIKILKSNIE